MLEIFGILVVCGAGSGAGRGGRVLQFVTCNNGGEEIVYLVLMLMQVVQEPLIGGRWQMVEWESGSSFFA